MSGVAERGGAANAGDQDDGAEDRRFQPHPAANLPSNQHDHGDGSEKDRCQFELQELERLAAQIRENHGRKGEIGHKARKDTLFFLQDGCAAAQPDRGGGQERHDDKGLQQTLELHGDSFPYRPSSPTLLAEMRLKAGNIARSPGAVACFRSSQRSRVPESLKTHMAVFIDRPGLQVALRPISPKRVMRGLS